jgi:RsiW-degrading membrane proteinase PrsW (M82 family)
MPNLLPVFASVLPFFCWVVESVLPYPYIVEEFAKFLLVIFVIGNKANVWQKAIVAGILFALTEMVFYSFNYLSTGNVSVVLTRLGLTTALHTLTYLVIVISYSWNKKLIILGLVIAILIHYFYNLEVTILF